MPAMRVLRIPSPQAGFSLAIVLFLLMILALLGGIVVRNVRSDIAYTGKETRNARLQYAAESAVNWALAEVTRTRVKTVGVVQWSYGAFTLSTHQPDGTTEWATSGSPPYKLMNADTYSVYSTTATASRDSYGWKYVSTTSASTSVSGLASSSKPERLSFKIWYPDGNSVRISAKAVVDGDSTQIEYHGKVN